MIHFVVTEKGSFSIRRYLAEDGAGVADRMRLVRYEDLPRIERLPLGTWVFTELDQLDMHQRELAALVAKRLRDQPAGVRILNDPEKVRLRLDLLRAAYRAGVNTHRAWPAADVLLDAHAVPPTADSETIAATSLRYPVFVRYANQHIGNLTPLLGDRRALGEALGALAATGVRKHELLVVEFCDTRDAHGVYRKCSAYNVGGCIIPRSLEQSRDWMVKWKFRIFDRVRADEELAYYETNPHAEWIREMFRLARIDYGRIDYGVLGDRPQLWEINTNPTIGSGPKPTSASRPDAAEYRKMIAPVRAGFYARFANAWAAVDTPMGDAPSAELHLPDRLIRAVERGEQRRRNAERLSAFVNVVARQPWMQPVTRAVKRALAPIMTARLR